MCVPILQKRADDRMWRYRLTDHEPRLLAEIQRQQKSNLFCDTLLQTSGVSIPVHSCIIAALSPYLSEKVSASPSSPSEENRRRLQLRSLSGHALVKVVGLLYSGELKVEDPAEREEVLAAARRLRVGGLVEVRRDGRRDSEVVVVGEQQQSRRTPGAETGAEIRVGEAGVQTVKCNEQAATGGSICFVRSGRTEPRLTSGGQRLLEDIGLNIMLPSMSLERNYISPHNHLQPNCDGATTTTTSTHVAAPCLAQGRSDEDHCAPSSSNLLPSSHRFNPNDDGTVVSTVEETPNATYGGTWNWTDAPLVTPNTPKPSSPQPGYYTTSDRRQETLSDAPRIPAAPADTNPESVEELPEEIERLLEHIMMIGLDMYGATTTTNTPQSSVPLLDRATTTTQCSVPLLDRATTTTQCSVPHLDRATTTHQCSVPLLDRATTTTHQCSVPHLDRATTTTHQSSVTHLDRATTTTTHQSSVPHLDRATTTTHQSSVTHLDRATTTTPQSSVTHLDRATTTTPQSSVPHLDRATTTTTPQSSVTHLDRATTTTHQSSVTHLDRATTTHQSSVPHLSVAKQGTPHPTVCTEGRTASDDASSADTGFHSACHSHFVPETRMPEPRYPEFTRHPEAPQRCPDFTRHPEAPQRCPDFTHHPEAPQRRPSTSCHPSTTAHSLRRPARLDERSFQNTPGVAQSAPCPHAGQPCRRPVAPPRVPAAPPDANPEAAVEESPEEMQRLLEDIGLNIMLPSMSLERNYSSPQNHLQPNRDGATTTNTTTSTHQSSVPHLSAAKQGTPHPRTEDRTASGGLADTGFQPACNFRMPEPRYPDFTRHPEAPQRCPSTSYHPSTAYSLRRPARLDERSFQITPGVSLSAPLPDGGQPSRRHYPARPRSSRPDSVPRKEDVLLRRRLGPSEPRPDTAEPRRPSFDRPANHGNMVQRSWLMTKPGVLQFPLVPRVLREEPCPSLPRPVRSAACSAPVVERRNLDSGPSAAEVATGSGVEDGGKRRRRFTSSHTLSRTTIKLGERCPSILRLGACSVRLSSNIVMAKEREMASRRMPSENAGKSKKPPENEKMKPGTSSNSHSGGPSAPGRSVQSVDLKRVRPREMKSTTGSTPKRKRVRRREMTSTTGSTPKRKRVRRRVTTSSNGLEETPSGGNTLVRSVQSLELMAPKRKRGRPPKRKVGRPRKIKQDHNMFCVAPSSYSSHIPASALCDIAVQISDKPSLLPKSNSTPEEQDESTPEHAEGTRVIKTKQPPTVTLRQFQELIQHRHWRTRESKRSNDGAESQEEVSCGTESSHEESARESEIERERAQIQGKREVKTIGAVHGFPFDQNRHRIITAENCGSQEADKRSQHEKMHEKKQQGHQSQNKNYISSETEGEESSKSTKEAVVHDVPSEETCQVADNGGEDLQDEALEAPARTSKESDTERPTDTTEDYINGVITEDYIHGVITEDYIHGVITERPADTTEDYIHGIILMLRECNLSAASETQTPQTL